MQREIAAQIEFSGAAQLCVRLQFDIINTLALIKGERRYRWPLRKISYLIDTRQTA